MVPDLGCQESVFDRRRGVRFQCGQESNFDDHGVGLALGRSHCRQDAEEGVVTDRRTTIKWMLSAAASMPLLNHRSWSQDVTAWPAVRGYGGDPDLTKLYRPGDVWPLTLSPAQRRTATALCNVVLPDDGRSPDAASVGVVDFIDEWVSAP